MSLKKDIDELVSKGIISAETADKIQVYYREKEEHSPNRILIAFGILGAILVGLGIILIIAYNWDELPRITKTILAFLPLAIGQSLCMYVLFTKKESITWRESCSAFLFFSVAATISLISQIYHIQGNLSSFLLTWMLLCFPLIYLMNSSITSLLYIAGITFYACESGYWTFPHSESYYYWVLILAVLPHYYFLFKGKPTSNFLIFHNWLLPLSLIISLGIIAKDQEELVFIAYMNLFAILYLIGSFNYFRQQQLRNNGFMVLGSIGTIVILLITSFNWFWQDLQQETFHWNEIVVSPEFIAVILLTIVSGILVFISWKKKSLAQYKPMEGIFILFILIYLIGVNSFVAVFLINVLILLLAIWVIREGATRDHLGILNYGLLIISALVICRFFDTDLSFILRGVLFVLVGSGFFVANYWMVKKRRSHED